MGQGLQLFYDNGVVMFDSDVAIGGVCLGFFVIPAAPYPFTATTNVDFPGFAVNRIGFVVSPICGLDSVGANYTYTTAPGYPRFVFDGSSFERNLMLFLK